MGEWGFDYSVYLLLTYLRYLLYSKLTKSFPWLLPWSAFPHRPFPLHRLFHRTFPIQPPGDVLRAKALVLLSLVQTPRRKPPRSGPFSSQRT